MHRKQVLHLRLCLVYKKSAELPHQTLAGPEESRGPRRLLSGAGLASPNSFQCIKKQDVEILLGKIKICTAKKCR